jgi:polyhydroxyalkanoate synthase
MRRTEADRYLDPDTFLAQAERKEGSWWPEWAHWLEEQSGAPVAPPRMGAETGGYPPLCDAPGTYVMER